MKKICVFLLLLIANSSFAQEQYDFAIYHDNNIGAWEDGIVAFEQFLNWKGVSHNRVTAQDVNTIILKKIYKVIYFPGGDADYYNADINSTGIQNIQEMITEGNAYIGICAGAEFACDKLVWQGVTYDYPLNLFQGKSIGPINELAVWDNYDMTTLTMNLENEINQFESENEDMLYWGGSIFSPYSNTVFDTIATFDGYYNRPAIINFNYGNGRVLLISPHPEIEEDSDRDKTNVAQELNDNGSDWNFLWAATDWLLGNSISTSNNVPNFSYSCNQNIKIYPNPANKILNIAINHGQEIERVVIYNQIGQIVLSEKPKNKSIDLSCFPKGIYIVEIEINGINYIEKLIISD